MAELLSPNTSIDPEKEYRNSDNTNSLTTSNIISTATITEAASASNSSFTSPTFVTTTSNKNDYCDSAMFNKPSDANNSLNIKRGKKRKLNEQDHEDLTEGQTIEVVDGVLTLICRFVDHDLKPNPNEPIRLSSVMKSKFVHIRPPENVNNYNGQQQQPLTCSIGKCGYSSVLATHGIREGYGFFEVVLLRDCQIRVGWSRETKEFNVPLGFDKNSFSYASKGQFFIERRGKPYGESFGRAGDTIGCLIYLPKRLTVKQIKTSVEAYEVEGVKYQIIKEEDVEEVSQGSFMQFFVNGKDQGIAPYIDLNFGKYYPGVSLYMEASVTFTFKDYRYPPPIKEKLFSW